MTGQTLKLLNLFPEQHGDTISVKQHSVASGNYDGKDTHDVLESVKFVRHSGKARKIIEVCQSINQVTSNDTSLSRLPV